MRNTENALGAPTEGLGQTVTFAVKGVDSAPQLQAGSAGQVDLLPQGAQGGQIELGGPVVQQPRDPTMALITKVIDKVSAQQMEKERKEAFLSGMQKAAAGAALLDVAAEQPWYSRIFGESDVVAGARAFTQQDKAQQTILALQEQMPELRKKGLDEARAVMSSAVGKAMTGDAEADTFLMQAFGRTIPSLMATHAREHYKYAQEQAVETHGKMLASGSRVLQEQGMEHAVNTTDSVEYDMAKAQYLGLIAKPIGMEDESYDKALSQHAMAAAENGDFHAIKVLRESGAIENLPENLRRTVLRTIDVNERNLPAGPLGDQFADDLYRLRRTAHQIDVNNGPIPTPDYLRAEYAKLNEEWMRRSGSTRPLVGKGTVTSEAVSMDDEIRQAIAADHRERVRAAKEAAREAKLNRLLSAQVEAEKSRVALTHTAWSMANPAMVLAGPGKLKEDEIDAMISKEMAPIFMKPGPLSQAEERQYERLGAFLQVGAGDKLMRLLLTPQYQAAKRAGTPATPQFAMVYENYLRMRKAAPDALGHMFDSDTLKELNLFHAQHPASLSAGEVTMAAAGAFAASIDPTTKLPKMTLDKAETGALIKQITKDKSFYLPEMMGGVPDIPDAQASRVAHRMSANIEALLPTAGSVEMATKQAWATYQQAGGRIVGGYEITDRGAKGVQDQQLFAPGNDAEFGNDPGVIGKGFRDFVHAQVAAVGGENPDNAVIQPTGDGKHFNIITSTREGLTHAIHGVAYADVGKAMNKKRKEEAAKKLTLGTHIKPGDYDKGVKIVQEELRNRKGP